MKRRLLAFAYTCVISMLVCSLAFGAGVTVRKWGISDMDLGPSNSTHVSPGGKTVRYFPYPYAGAGTSATDNAAIVDVRAYGAVGDNTTDDTAAIQAAINAVNAAGGGTVLFPKGMYKITSTITLYGNIRYLGTTQAGHQGDTVLDHGATLKWAGAGTTGTMVRMNDTRGVIWDGINLRGNLDTVPTSTLTGITINTNTGSSTRNYIRNLSIHYADNCIAFGNEYPSGGNTDSWVVENFDLNLCNVGVLLNDQNIAGSVVRNGTMTVYDVGVDVLGSGFIKFESITFGTREENGAGTVFRLNTTSGNVLIEQCQSEGVGTGAGLDWAFLTVTDTNNGYAGPLTLLNNQIDQHIYYNDSVTNVASIGNVYNDNVWVNGTDTYITSMMDRFTTGNSFIDNSAGFTNRIYKLSGGTFSMMGGGGTPNAGIGNITLTKSYQPPTQGIDNNILLYVNDEVYSGYPSLHIMRNDNTVINLLRRTNIPVTDNTVNTLRDTVNSILTLIQDTGLMAAP